jgi:hypothetical protein
MERSEKATKTKSLKKSRNEPSDSRKRSKKVVHKVERSRNQTKETSKSSKIAARGEDQSASSSSS